MTVDAFLHRMPWTRTDQRRELLLSREWLVTNGLGGYAGGSIAGACTRRYHGLLVAALPAPLGRVVMLAHLAEEVRLSDGRLSRLGGEERPGEDPELHGAQVLSEFRLESGLPVWRYEMDGCVLEKRLVLVHLQNTVHITYRLVSASGPVRLRLRPSMHFRAHEARVDAPLVEPYRVLGQGCLFEIRGQGALPPLRVRVFGDRAAFVLDGGQFRDIFYRVEAHRGYDCRGAVWSPGYMRADLAPGTSATLVASTEEWERLGALSPDEALDAERERRQRLLAQADPRARDHGGAELVLAADQFLIKPGTRLADEARAQAAGDDVRTVIAGYHWFTDWGRDTMISLEGLAIVTGRHDEAGWILRTFAHYVRDGLIPNLFPEHSREGLYHTADATLWYFHAVERYLRATGDRVTLSVLLPTLVSIVEHHLRGTRFGIGVDPVDGLLRQGAEGYQLTWMDAKVDDWVVTPRRGKAVEINALWYNALRLLEGWLTEAGEVDRARVMGGHATRSQGAFNARFWYAQGGHLYDVIDGEGGSDPAVRPNQVLAISLTHAVLDRERWGPVLDVVRAQLLTPLGLRSLSPSHADYKKRYDGDLRSRDAAYHQGTVWAWLIGPFLDAWLKVHPGEAAQARGMLSGLLGHLQEACLGSVSEVFDAEEPYTPRGCVAQAWSVAELLRCWVNTAE
jgi:predicted glycogen debranching enzyme